MSFSPYVLVVEDNPDHRLLIGAILRRFLPPTDVCLVDSAEAAIRYLTGNIPFDGPKIEPPALILLDLHLPGMSGFDLLAWLKEGSGPDVPVIVLSSSTDPRDRRRALELGADAYREKPEDFGALVELVLPYVGPEIELPRKREDVG